MPLRLPLQWLRHRPRTVAFLILAGVTLWQGWAFFSDDWRAVLNQWHSHAVCIMAALACNVVGLGCDFWAWRSAYRLHGLRLPLRQGLAAYLSGFAAQLVPLQLGRVLRPDSVSRLQGAPFSRALLAEVSLFALDVAALGCSILAFVSGMYYLPLLFCVFGCFAVGVYMVPRFVPVSWAQRLGFQQLSVGARKRILAVWALRCLDWTALAVVLVLLVRPWATQTNPLQIMAGALAASVVGTGSGLPGGIGATEGSLAFFLSLSAISAAYGAVVVFLYRLITFWAQIPLGWLALLYVRALEKKISRYGS